MSESLADMRDKAQKIFNTNENTHEMFPIGIKVKVITPCEDFQFFYGETGAVLKNTGKYLGIQVKFDKPREFKDGTVQYSWNFGPKSLYIFNDWDTEENR